MMMSMFSIFDPSSTMNSNLNWLVFIFPLILIPSSFWIMSNITSKMNNIMSTNINQELKPNMSINSHFAVMMFFPLFFVFMLNNSFGLLPFIFTSTSHMLITLPVALTLWMSFILYGWIINTKNMLSHLVPSGTPFNLMMFMVLIELISSIIRPLTLAVRLMANMTAGHLMMSLISSQMVFINSSMMMVTFGQTMLMILEIAVSLIQAYVMTILLTMYMSESS